MKPRMPGLQLSRLPGAEVVPLRIPGHHRICNPSIAINDRGIFCTIREVNYDLDENGAMAEWPPEGLRSHDWFARLDSDLKILELQRIDLSALDMKYPEQIEDSRLLWWKDAWWLSATRVIEFRPSLCEMTLCRLEGAKIVEQHLLPSPTQAPMDKNWMPRVSEGRLEWVHWIDPTAILTYDGAQGLSRRIVGQYGRLDNWRGSSPLVRYGEHWICAIHRTKRKKVARYLHRLVELDDDFKIRRISPVFTFEGRSVEFCAGLCVTQTHVLLSYGVWDREAHLMRLELSEIEAMLRPFYIPRLLSVFVMGIWRVLRPWFRQPRKTVVAMMRRAAAAK